MPSDAITVGAATAEQASACRSADKYRLLHLVLGGARRGVAFGLQSGNFNHIGTPSWGSHFVDRSNRWYWHYGLEQLAAKGGFAIGSGRV
jgi:hypothetical protein